MELPCIELPEEILILYNQIFKGDKSEHQMFQEISDTLTVMASEVN